MKLVIDGMTCGGCSSSVKKALEEMPGVITADVSHSENMAQVAVEEGTPADALIQRVKKMGYEVALGE